MYNDNAIKRILFLILIVLIFVFALFSCTEKESDPDLRQKDKEGGSVTVYPLPSCYEASEQAGLTVNGEEAYIIKNQEQYDYCSFAFSGTVTVQISVNEKIESYSLSPLAKGYEASAKDNVLTFTMDKPEYLIVKINSLREIVICADAPEENPPAPDAEGVFNIAAQPYGCVPDSSAVVTEKIQQAMDDAMNAGGGTVYVPEGVFVTGCLNLHANVHLYLAPGAVLRLTDNPRKLVSTWSKASINGYTTLPTGGKGPWKGVTLLTCDANSQNIKIYGRGTVDGRGVYMCNKKGFVVKLFYPKDVTGLTIDGVIMRDASSWNTVIYACSDVNITNIKVFNEVHTMYEDDGIDIANSQNVRVTSSVMISEDDPASIKGMDDSPMRPCTDVVFEDVFVWTTTSAFKVGWRAHTDISNVAFKNSYCYSCKNGIGVFHYDGAAEFDDITFENIDIENFLGKYKDGKREPTRAFYFEILNRGMGANAVTNVTLKSINFRNPADNKNLMNSLNRLYAFRGIHFEDVTYCGKKFTSADEIFEDRNFSSDITVN